MLNKQQAAEFLGVNVRTLERYTQEGKIGSRYEKGKTRSVVVYDEEELRAFKAAQETAAQETKTYKPAVDPTPTNPDRDEAALSKFVEGTQPLHLHEGLNHKRGCVEGNTFRAVAPSPHRPHPSPPHLEPSRSYAPSGISRLRLRAAIKDGTLTAQVIGRGYRVKRTDLEDYVDSL